MEAFWAKTPIDPDQKNSWETIHSVYHHGIDVGLTTEILLNTRFASLAEEICQPYTDISLGKKSISALSALHDIGKITAMFQNKVSILGESFTHKGFPKSFESEGRDYHGQDTAEFLLHFFASEWEDADSDILYTFAQIPAAHHGFFFSPSCDERIQDQWEIERFDHTYALCEHWFPDTRRIPYPDNPNFITPAWTMLCTGLVSVSDWIGSSLSFLNNTESHDEYIAIRKNQINETLQSIGFVYE